MLDYIEFYPLAHHMSKKPILLYVFLVSSFLFIYFFIIIIIIYLFIFVVVVKWKTERKKNMKMNSMLVKK